MLTAILFVLKTGIGWKDLPTEAFGVSYKTCTRRIADWTGIGLWQRMHELFLAKLRSADQLDWLAGANWMTSGTPPASVSKHCLLTDAGGVPLVIQLAPANQHDVKELLPLVVEIPAVAGKPGRPKQKPDSLLADKAFDCEALRQLLRWLGIEPHLPYRGDDEHGLGVLRWFVERTLSWLHQFRRLRIRWDRCPVVHQAFLSLAAAVICFRIWKWES